MKQATHSPEIAEMMRKARRRNREAVKRYRRKPGASWRVLAWANRGRTERSMKNEGVFDELVLDDWLHLEQMDTRHWFLLLPGERRISIRIPRDPKKPVEVMQYDGPPLPR